MRIIKEAGKNMEKPWKAEGYHIYRLRYKQKI
jgi:hypothetical protein